ncbi:Glycosyltransferase involved in cell wall bisynthesis [Flavobacterium gillisiae]|uniref:Glycosyltransferase involved in cell wall bisynthesis n=1 Tax=Flavobacterium gillisiae TaxID=150146 RepID=A0A1H4ESC4_9FLAO|nr:glycosyltransferase [Flavobacterium gillisiae]SEA87162.1 Glycosyltransferase involved in cell wall bisynthesis [Flavobacterium gillisiae]
MSTSILFYFNSLQPSGGIERVISTLANKLCETHIITIVVKDPAISFYPLDSRIILVSLNNELNFDMNSRFKRLFTAARSALKNAIALHAFLKENKFDNYYIAHPLNAMEFHLARGFRRTDTIVTEHGGVDAYNLVYKKIKDWIYAKAKVYVVPTTTDTEIYKKLGYPTQYIPHFRSDLKYEKSTLELNTVLTIGRFTDVKQHLLLLKVWKQVIDAIPSTEWKLQIVGEGELHEDYINFINVNKLHSSVAILKPNVDVAQFYKSASVFVMTSKSEGFGMVLLEAISFGLPCISFDCPAGPRDMINDKNGFLIGPNDEIALKNALIELIRKPDLHKRLGAQAYLDSVNWQDENILKHWLKILN